MDSIEDPDSGLFKTDCLIAPDPCSEQLFGRQKYIEDRKMVRCDVNSDFSV